MKNKLIKVIMLILSVSSITAFSGVGVTTNVQASQAQTDIDKVSVMQRDIPSKSSFYKITSNNSLNNGQMLNGIFSGLSTLVATGDATFKALEPFTQNLKSLGSNIPALSTILAGFAMTSLTVPQIFATITIVISIVLIAYLIYRINTDGVEGIKQDFYTVSRPFTDLMYRIKQGFIAVKELTEVLSVGLTLLLDSTSNSILDLDTFNTLNNATDYDINGALSTFQSIKFSHNFIDINSIPLNTYNTLSYFGNTISTIGPKMAAFDMEYKTFRLLDTYELSTADVSNFGNISGTAKTYIGDDNGNISNTGMNMLRRDVGYTDAKLFEDYIKTNNKLQLYNFISNTNESSALYAIEDGSFSSVISLQQEFLEHYNKYMKQKELAANSDITLKVPDLNLGIDYNGEQVKFDANGQLINSLGGVITSPNGLGLGMNPGINTNDDTILIPEEGINWHIDDEGNIRDEYNKLVDKLKGLSMTDSQKKALIFALSNTLGIEVSKHAYVYTLLDLVYDEIKGNGHTIINHLLITDEQTKERAKNEQSGTATKFNDPITGTYYALYAINLAAHFRKQIKFLSRKMSPAEKEIISEQERTLTALVPNLTITNATTNGSFTYNESGIISKGYGFNRDGSRIDNTTDIFIKLKNNGLNGDKRNYAPVTVYPKQKGTAFND